jgi:hypothetical protein
MRPRAPSRGARRSDGIDGPARGRSCRAVSWQAPEWRRAPPSSPEAKQLVTREWKRGGMDRSPASRGIAVAKATGDAALLSDGQLHQRSCARTASGFDALHAGMKQRGVEPVHACLEATGEYGAAVALSLYETGPVVRLVKPARIAVYGKSRLARTKTDPADAARIARFCHTQPPVPWSPPPVAVREVQARVRQVEMLGEEGTAEGESAAERAPLAGRAGVAGGHSGVRAARDGGDAAPGPRAGGAVGGPAAPAAPARLDPGKRTVDRRGGAGRERARTPRRERASLGGLCRLHPARTPLGPLRAGTCPVWPRPAPAACGARSTGPRLWRGDTTPWCAPWRSGCGNVASARW